MKIFYILALTIFASQATYSQTGSNPASGAQGTTRILKFYPNPATSIINFDFESGFEKNYNFQIYSFLGKKVFELNNISPKTKVNLNDFYRGIYIFQLRDRNGKVIDSGKFQVAR